jgi:aminopeptidase N
VLASPETATDRDYDFIEGIVAHEYFHNWTGNRITCRDWFQLCLKEGLTVFRDQQFSADMRSAPVKRIDDVLTLRARQFREDAGRWPIMSAPKAISRSTISTPPPSTRRARRSSACCAAGGPRGYARAHPLFRPP